MNKSIIKNKKQTYQSPEVEVFIFKMEAGFAESAGLSIDNISGSSLP